jgi:predicted anti-sigma-YlaC factor YlaD
MDCQIARTLLSASLDGETRPAEELTLGDHLGACPACRAYAADARSLHRIVRVAPAEMVPDLTAEILAATAPPATDSASGRGLRLGLVAIAVVQILIALPGLLSPAEHTSHLAAFDLALAAGFCWVAARPTRALSGFLPIATVLVVLCAGLAVTDAARGYGETFRAVAHSLAVLGIISAWLLEAQTHRRAQNLPLAA